MEWMLTPLDILSVVPRWYVGACFGTVFFLYYLRDAVKLPTIACAPGKFRQFLEDNVPILKEKFWPTLWCFESRAQTVLASLLRSQLLPEILYRREILRLSDGGQVALDWLEDGCAPKSPIVIILPGLTGASQADYVKTLVRAANKLGLRVVVFNNRGLGGISLKTPRTYCAANCEDLSAVIHHVQTLNPNVPLAATGISMGGLILGNYLAAEELAARKKFVAAMVISVPWNVFKGSESIEKPFLNLMLNRHLCEGLCKLIEGAEELGIDVPWDMNEIRKSRTIREFDANFTVKQFGFKDVFDYYSQATLHNKLHKIAVPLLCLNAADDPFQPLDAIPVEAANNSKNVAMVITARGGHIGFLEGIMPAYQTETQYMSRLFSQYFSAVFREETGFFNLLDKAD
ncbi:phospholipase ABHD3 [Schistocerca nitens]|uniref:phospholipase ABHD3 n=1 Tax=Schistocerca nitens TaxID=7011 RepID=UPI0021192461|nr:phospholipase ABHD3 [Schistocerca nitens]XP_049861657.1 phospholipase ABHD3 [Schistocerca gregaria]